MEKVIVEFICSRCGYKFRRTMDKTPITKLGGHSTSSEIEPFQAPCENPKKECHGMAYGFG